MRVGLLLNSCFFGFYAHFGFARALEAAGVPIVAAGGSSAGALVAATVASGLGAARGLDMALGLGREDFWDPDTRTGSLLRVGRVRGERIEQLLSEQLPVSRIEDCPRPLAISAVTFPLLAKVILRRGPLARAIRASCAVPFLIQPVPWEGRLLWDGGTRIEAPLRALVDAHGLDLAIVHVGRWARPGERGSDAVPIAADLRADVAYARARGVRVLVARTLYPRLDPDRLTRSPEAVAAGAESARRVLERLGRVARTG